MIAQYLQPVRERIRLALGQGRGVYLVSLAASQLAPLISAPIVSRLYSPEDFGIYGIFYAVVAVLSSISSLALHNAIILRDAGEPSFHAVVLSLGITFGFSIVLFLIILFAGEDLIRTFFKQELQSVIHFLPLTVLFSGVLMCLTSWAIRRNKFGLLARNKIVLAIATAILQIAGGLWGIGAIGFVFANLLGVGLSILLFSMPFVEHSKRLGFKPSIAGAAKVLIEQKLIVYWMFPANLVSSVCSFMPELLIGRVFGVALLGQFVLANRMVTFPVAFISAGIQDIFRQQAVAEFEGERGCRRTFWRFFLLLTVVSIMVLLPIILIAPHVFQIIFGSQWTEAGTLIQAVAFLTIVRFISSPLSYIWIIQGRQRLDFLWQVGLMALSLTTLILPPLLKPQITLHSTLLVYSVAVGLWYVLAIFISYRLSRQARKHSDQAAH